jgi:type II secretory pathway pseudopilin PulG
MPRLNPPPKRLAFNLVELLVVIGMIGALACLLIPAVERVREAAARTQCQNNLRWIAVGAHNRNDSLGHLPPTVGWTFPSTPWSEHNAFGSFFFHVLPYLE